MKYNVFHPFPRLPIEIRLKIWSLTLNPRIMDIWGLEREDRPQPCHPDRKTICLRPEVDDSSFPRPNFMFTYASRRTPLLTINRESRYWALENHIYTLTSDLHGEFPAGQGPKVAFKKTTPAEVLTRAVVVAARKEKMAKEVFDAKRDVLYFHRGDFMHQCCSTHGYESVPGYMLLSAQSLAKALGPEVTGKVRRLALDWIDWQVVAGNPDPEWLRDWEGLEEIIVVFAYLKIERVWAQFEPTAQQLLNKFAAANIARRVPTIRYMESRDELMEDARKTPSLAMGNTMTRMMETLAREPVQSLRQLYIS